MPQATTATERQLGRVLEVVDDFSVRRDEHLRHPQTAVRELSEKLTAPFGELGVATVPALVQALDAMERGAIDDSDLRARLRDFIENYNMNSQGTRLAAQLNLAFSAR